MLGASNFVLRRKKKGQNLSILPFNTKTNLKTDTLTAAQALKLLKPMYIVACFIVCRQILVLIYRNWLKNVRSAHQITLGIEV